LTLAGAGAVHVGFLDTKVESFFTGVRGNNTPLVQMKVKNVRKIRHLCLTWCNNTFCFPHSNFWLHSDGSILLTNNCTRIRWASGIFCCGLELLFSTPEYQLFSPSPLILLLNVYLLQPVAISQNQMALLSWEVKKLQITSY
jgi:hypothetical protein